LQAVVPIHIIAGSPKKTTETKGGLDTNPASIKNFGPAAAGNRRKSEMLPFNRAFKN
jgi:hypothetical protein